MLIIHSLTQLRCCVFTTKHTSKLKVASVMMQGGGELESVLSERLRQLPAPAAHAESSNEDAAELGISQTLEPEVAVRPSLVQLQTISQPTRTCKLCPTLATWPVNPGRLDGLS